MMMATKMSLLVMARRDITDSTLRARPMLSSASCSCSPAPHKSSHSAHAARNRSSQEEASE
jgi:hypothetical protein